MGIDADIARRRPRGLNGDRARRPAREAGAAALPLRRPAAEGDDGAEDGDPRQRIVIELSHAQVDRIVRSAADAGNMSVLLSGLKDVREAIAREPRQLEDSRLSRSLLAGLLMLASFPSDGSYLGNADIARMLDMNPSTTHRYVSTLVTVGLIERDPATRRYRLA
jgi:hypothetical protein